MGNVFRDETKKLGFGLMRLPMIEGKDEIDIETMKQMVDYFMEQGFTYFDTAFMYPGSEDTILHGCTAVSRVRMLQR